MDVLSTYNDAIRPTKYFLRRFEKKVATNLRVKYGYFWSPIVAYFSMHFFTKDSFLLSKLLQLLFFLFENHLSQLKHIRGM